MIHISERFQRIICYTIFAGIGMLALHSLYAKKKDIDMVRSIIREHIVNHRPDLMDNYNRYLQEADFATNQFFNLQNNEAFRTHVERIKASVDYLKERILNPINGDATNPYVHVFTKFVRQLDRMNTIMASYIGHTGGSLWLGLRLRGYRHLTPKSIGEGRVMLIGCDHSYGISITDGKSCVMLK